MRKRDDDGYILSVTVHRSDRLRPDLYISHPLVRVHVMDIDTENYVKKSNRFVLKVCAAISQIATHLSADLK